MDHFFSTIYSEYVYVCVAARNVQSWLTIYNRNMFNLQNRQCTILNWDLDPKRNTRMCCWWFYIIQASGGRYRSCSLRHKLQNSAERESADLVLLKLITRTKSCMERFYSANVMYKLSLISMLKYFKVDDYDFKLHLRQRWLEGVILRSGHKSDHECFVAAQVSPPVGKGDERLGVNLG